MFGVFTIIGATFEKRKESDVDRCFDVSHVVARIKMQEGEIFRIDNHFADFVASRVVMYGVDHIMFSFRCCCVYIIYNAGEGVFQ